MTIASQTTEVRLLEGFDVIIGGRSMVLPRTCQRLLACVALSPSPHPRAYFAHRLWPDDTPQRAAANLRSALWRIRRTTSHLVECSASHVVLTAGRLDVRETIRALQEDMNGTMRTVSLGRLPLTAELLPAWHDDWVAIERERYRQFRLHALESMSSRLVTEGRYASAIEVALTAIVIDPFRASARRLLIQAYLAEGNRSEAVRELDRYTNLLQRRLGIKPPADLALCIQSARTLE